MKLVNQEAEEKENIERLPISKSLLINIYIIDTMSIGSDNS